MLELMRTDCTPSTLQSLDIDVTTRTRNYRAKVNKDDIWDQGWNQWKQRMESMESNSPDMETKVREPSRCKENCYCLYHPDRKFISCGICIFLFLGFSAALDIAALVIVQSSNCQYVDHKNIDLDVDTWLMVGSIIHLFLFVNYVYNISMYLWGEKLYGTPCESFENIHCCTICIGFLEYLVCISWMITGFLLYSVMIESEMDDGYWIIITSHQF